MHKINYRHSYWPQWSHLEFSQSSLICRFIRLIPVYNNNAGKQRERKNRCIFLWLFTFSYIFRLPSCIKIKKKIFQKLPDIMEHTIKKNALIQMNMMRAFIRLKLGERTQRRNRIYAMYPKEIQPDFAVRIY